MNNTNLEGAVLKGGILDQDWMLNANLSGADLEAASLFQTQLIGADLSGANLRGARTAGDFSRANLKGADFSADMKNQSMGLMRGVVRKANAEGANFGGASFAGANLMAATLGGADFTGANVEGARFQDADLTSTRLVDLVGATPDQFANSRNLDRAFRKLDPSGPWRPPDTCVTSVRRVAKPSRNRTHPRRSTDPMAPKVACRTDPAKQGRYRPFPEAS